jgi:exopolysaccharide production protein ExoZ
MTADSTARADLLGQRTAPVVSHLDSLQALRALAATTVVFDHIQYLRWGAFGVDIFFVLSGFIMCHISSSDSSRFFIKRIIRVVPLYWFCTLGVAAIALLKPGLLLSTSFSSTALLKSLFFIPFRRPDHRIAPLLFLGWTLQYEMLFYAIFGTVLKITRKHVRSVTMVAIVLLFAIGKLLRVYHHHFLVLNFYSSFVILEFALGILCYILWARYGAAFRRVHWTALIPAAALSYVFFVLMDLHILESYGPALRYVPDFLLRGFPASLLLLSFLSLEGRFRFPALVLLIGDASYSLYLLHPYILGVLDRKLFVLDHFSPFTLAVTVVSIAICYACAIVSFKGFERPSNAFLRKLFLRRDTPPARKLQAAAAP